MTASSFVGLLPDIVGPNMRLLVCGLNPSLVAAETGIPYAGRGNRFWPAAIEAGLVTKDRDPHDALVSHGIGFTDLCPRASSAASEVARDEYRSGLARVEALVARLQPAAVCFVGLSGWRQVVDRRAVPGPQNRDLAGRPVYLMPSTSGRNAATPIGELIGHMRAALPSPPMVSMAQAREIALGFREATEEPHHDMTSFRVRSKIFATVPDDGHLNVMLAPDDAYQAIAEHPRALEELWWGKQLSGVRVDLKRATPQVVSDVLEQAWRRRAPKIVVGDVDGRRGNDELEPVLGVLRTWPELTEKGRAVFYAKRKAFLHFHQSKTSRRADVRDGKDWGAPIPLPVGPLPTGVQRTFLKEVRRRLNATLA